LMIILIGIVAAMYFLFSFLSEVIFQKWYLTT